MAVLSDRGLRKLLDRITAIETKLRASGTLKRQLGKLLTEQTKRRIRTEKRAPSGRKWKPWSHEYARTRGPGHSLLINRSDLLDSIKASVTKDGASVTSDVDYSGVVQSARPFLGISRQNWREIDALVADWVARI